MFDDQMAALAETGSAISVDEAVGELGSGRSLSGRVAVTFDDGTADFVDTALPVLARHASRRRSMRRPSTSSPVAGSPTGGGRSRGPGSPRQ